jgi:hypothetical protein
MRDLPVPPYDLALNTTMQTVATVVLWGGSIALLGYAYRLVRQERSLFPLLLVLAVAAGSVIEPLYDIAYHLFWLDNGQQWTLFTAFGLPHPVWVIPSTLVMWLSVPISVAFSATSLWWTTQLLEHQRRSVVEKTLQPA